MDDRAEHTAGPWSMEGPDPFGDYNIHEPTARLAIGAVVSNLRSPKVVEANAHLIAAAPDLLAALQGLVEVNEAHNESIAKIIGKPLDWKDDYLEAARAAISRATGEA